MIRSSSRRKLGHLPKQRNSGNFNLGEKRTNEIPKKARSKRQRVPTVRNKIAKNENIIACLIDTGVVKENEMVRYMDKNCLHPNKDGMITQRDKFCLCCCEIFTAREFQFHGSELADKSRELNKFRGGSFGKQHMNEPRKQDIFPQT
ncbi:hypothetical protein LguiA_034097 [Lonicera macranthoides]